MRALSTPVKVCTVAVLGLGLTLSGVAAANAATVAGASQAQQAVTVTSSLTAVAGQDYDLTGTARPGSTVTVLGLPGHFIVDVKADDEGMFRYHVADGFPAGVYLVSLASSGSVGTQVELQVTDADGTVPGVVPVEVTSATTYRIDQPAVLEGTAAAGSDVRVRVLSTTSTIRVTPAADGTWRWQSDKPLTGTSQSLEVTQEQAGRLVKTPVTMTAVDAAGDPAHLAPIVVTSAPTYVPGKPLEVSGTATPGAQVSVDARATGFGGGSTTADEDGKWSYRSAEYMRGTEHQIRVRQQHALGSDATSIRFTAVTESGAAASFEPITVEQPSFVPNERLSLSGTATPGARVVVSTANYAISGESVTADADGNWSFTSRNALRGLRHEVRVRQDSPLGSDSKTVSVQAIVDGKPVAFHALERTSAATYVPGTTTTLNGVATPFSSVRVDLSAIGKPIPNTPSFRQFYATADAHGAWSVSIPDHRLPNAKVSQEGELGRDSISFEFTRG